mgnify:CR=1 FL=1|jgi:hypothetical protein
MYLQKDNKAKQSYECNKTTSVSLKLRAAELKNGG